MKDILVFGNGRISKILSTYIKKKFNIKAYTVFKKFLKQKKFNDLPIIETESLKKKYSPKKYKIIIAVGYLEMNDVRKHAFKFLKKEGYNFENYIDNDSLIFPNMKIGTNNFILENVSINPETKIGSGNVVWSNSVISHNVSIKDFNWISSGCVISGDCKVGNNNFFGSNSTISNNTFIPNYTFLGAGTLISGKIESNKTYIKEKTIKYNFESKKFLKLLKNE